MERPDSTGRTDGHHRSGGSHLSAGDAHAAGILALEGVLESMAQGASLDALAAATCKLIEEIDPPATAALLVLSPDGQQFARAFGACAAAPLREIVDWPLDSPAHRCPCAAAVLQNQQTICLNLHADTRWSEQWRSVMIRARVQSCLAHPICDPRGTPLGCLLVGYATPAMDDHRWDSDLIHRGSHLGALILERAHAAHEIEDLQRELEHRRRREGTFTQMQRLEALGQITAGVAHDFNNLLTVVLGNLDYIERRADLWSTQAVHFARRLSYARTAAEHCSKLIAQLLAFSRRQPLEPQVIDVNAAIAEMRYLLQSTLSHAVTLDLSIGDRVWPVAVDAPQLELVILNLTINARDAMPDGGRLRLATANATLCEPHPTMGLATGDYVVLSVSDTGVGMTDEVLAHAFEPFFTTKEIGKGTGLGLAQIYGFAKQSGGGVGIQTHVDEGTTVSVYLPRALPAVEDTPQRRPDMESSLTDRRILVVDDDSAVRQVTQTMLAELGCTVFPAENAFAAMEIVRSDTELDMVVADFAMPGMHGADLACEVRKLRPDLPVLIVTGYAEGDGLLQVPSAAVLQKPFRREQLVAKIRTLLAH